MISHALKNLLDAIGKHEAPKGYGQIYGGARGVPKNTDVSKLTLNGVQALQAKMVKNGSASTASGRYQFIRKTLALTISEMGLTGKEVWTPALQDRMAVHLIEKRGLGRFLAGKLSREQFANNLAAEWASLPMVNGPKKGRSKYAGDGLNKSFHSVAAVLALVDALRADKPESDRIGPGSSAQLVEALQKVLADKQYPVGRVDGKWGRMTRDAVMGLKADNGLDVSDPSITLAEAAAAKPRVIETRKDATVADLREEGSQTVAGADQTQIVSAVGGGVTAVGAGVSYLDKAEETSSMFSRLKWIIEPFQGLLPWILDNLWVIIIAIAGTAFYFAYRVKKKRLEEFKVGKVQ